MTTARFFFILFIVFFTCTSYGQIDKEFWFVGPEVSASHGDRPVYLRISTMNDPANITLRMPANNKFTPVKTLVAANATFSIRLDNIDGNPSWLDSIENRPASTILNKGLLLTSDHYISTYYEIANTNNPGIFPLKGKNGVGLEFYIPGQTDYPNHVNNGSEAFDIVATRDTTIVTITPSIDADGHPANVTFQVILNKGETYSVRTLNTTASASLAGSHVTANKPVAITISDDSIVTGGWDIIGDQIVPVNLLGKEYIAIKGYADNNPPSNNDERVYITAISDNTEIRIDGNATPVATLNAGEQYDHGIPSGTNTAYIKATNPVYVYHLTGHPGEAGSSILPHDSCTGSRKVGFNRSSTSAFAMMILTRSGNENSFILNGNSTTIAGSSFLPVPGTNGNWVYYRQNNMTVANVPVGANILENTSAKFHLGILNNVGASSEYGYFSDFSTLFLGSDANMCPGDSIVLDGGLFRTSYEWKKLVAGVWNTVGTNQTYTCYDTGYFACITNGDFCLLMDTIRISFYPNASVSLGSNRTICEGTNTTFSLENYQSYEWNDGSSAPTFTTGQEGSVWVRVMNNDGCVATDTTFINVDSVPFSNHPVTGPVAVCQGQSGVLYSIDSLSYAASYQWALPPGLTGSSNADSIVVAIGKTAINGTLSVRGVNGCGNGQLVNFSIQVNPLPAAAGGIVSPDSVCEGQSGISISIPAIANATSYQWKLPSGFSITGGGNNSITVSAGLNSLSDTISVKGINSCGAGDSSRIFIHVGALPKAAGPIAGSAVVCQGQLGVVYKTGAIERANTYLWTIPPGCSITSGSGTDSITVMFDSTAVSGVITVKGHSNECGDGPAFSFSVTVNPLPSPAGNIIGPAETCEGQNGVIFSIVSLANTNSYKWVLPAGAVVTAGAATNQITTSFNPGSASGLVMVQGFNANCGNGKAKSRMVIVNPLPLNPGSITGPDEVCQGDRSMIYSVGFIDPLTSSYQWIVNPSGAATITGNGSSVSVNWSAQFSGNATLQVNGLNGCGTGPASPLLSVKVNFHNQVSFTTCFDLKTTKNAQPILLRGGNPAGSGGVYSGTGVIHSTNGDWYFDPGQSLISGSPSGTAYQLIYRYTNSYNCANEAVQTIRVFPSNALQPCPGTMTDVRDGKSYPTFTIGNGTSARCWMATNLDYGSLTNWQKPQTDNCGVEKFCADNLDANCGLYGGYYQWSELMQYRVIPGAQGICPPGWHVPLKQEWGWLFDNYLGPGMAGTPLKDTTDSRGFSGLLNGVVYLNNQWHFTTGSIQASMFWSSSTGSGLPLAFGINSVNPSVSEYASSPANAFQIRCVRDE